MPTEPDQRDTTVLVVDDDEMMRAFLESFLGEHFGVMTRENGREALEVVRGPEPPDLVILDLSMPEVDGFAFLEQVRANRLFDSLPIIVLSGSEQSETRVQCLKAGADDFLVKPFNPDELGARVDNLLRRLRRT